MLVLTRKTNESILIGDDIKITLVKVSGGSVRIGIDAPKNVKIIRSELLEALHQVGGEEEPNDFEIDDVAAVFANPSDNQQRRGSGHVPMATAIREDDQAVGLDRPTRLSRKSPLASFMSA